MKDSEILQHAIELLSERALPDVRMRDVTSIADVWVGLHRLHAEALQRDQTTGEGGVIVGEAVVG